MCQTPFIFPVRRFSHWQKPRWEAGEVRCSSPVLTGVGFSSGWFLSQNLLKILHFYSGFCENVGQCGMGRGTGSVCMSRRGLALLRASQPKADGSCTQVPAYISLGKGQTGFLMKHSPHFSDWWLLIFFYIWYFSNAINFSNLFSAFNNKAGTENQQYYYSLRKHISICKRLLKSQDSQRPFLPLNQGIYFKHKQLLLRQATVNALANRRWNMTCTALMAPRTPPAHSHPKDHVCLSCCQAPTGVSVLIFLWQHLCTTGTKLTHTC